jgi:hypothetical protein
VRSCRAAVVAKCRLRWQVGLVVPGNQDLCSDHRRLPLACYPHWTMGVARCGGRARLQAATGNRELAGSMRAISSAGRERYSSNRAPPTVDPTGRRRPRWAGTRIGARRCLVPSPRGDGHVGVIYHSAPTSAGRKAREQLGSSLRARWDDTGESL